jgi:hypothetical protein
MLDVFGNSREILFFDCLVAPMEYILLATTYIQVPATHAYRCASGSSVILCDSFTSAASPVGSSGYDVEGSDSRYFRWCSWA